MRRHLQFLVAAYVATMLLFTANRVVFLIYNHTLAEECSFGEQLLALWHGLALDSVVAGYIVVIPLLLCVASVWLPLAERGRRVVGRTMVGYFALVATLVAVVETADIGIFEEWQSRIDAQVLIYSPKEMMASVSAANAVAALLYILATVGVAVWLYRRIVRRLFEPSVEAFRGLSIAATRVLTSLGMLLVAGVLFVIIRGGFTPAVANVSKAYFSPKMFLNQAAINPLFTLLDSLTEGDDLDEYNFFAEEDAEVYFSEALCAEPADSLSGAEHERWLTTTRPNIVLIMAEGMGRTITDAQCGGEAVTPSLDALRSEGIWFENLYASSFRTDRGTVATLSGFPAQPKMSIMKYPSKAAHLPGIAAELRDAGYLTRFFYGGDANFTNTRAYLYATGFSEIVDQSSLPVDGHHSKWGLADDVVADYATTAILQRMAGGTKSFDVLLTLSSHEPFDVPYRRLSDDMLNSFAFTDSVIGAVVERLRASEHWATTLVIIIPDHGYPYPASVGKASPERHHIPMLWVGGAVAKSRTVEAFASQTDLVATLLGQMELPADDFTFSRDIAAGDVSKFGYWTFNNGFGLIDSRGWTIYDHATSEAVSSNGEGEQQRLEAGKAMLQKTFMEIKQL